MNESPVSEQQAFSSRLIEALIRSGLSARQTEVWRGFNRIYSGSPVSIHAVRKWLVGESIPTQDKLRTLAAWLAVSVNWLRYGDEVQPPSDDPLAPSEWRFIQDFRSLSDAERERFSALIRVIVSRDKT
jgi:hypothetical protein